MNKLERNGVSGAVAPAPAEGSLYGAPKRDMRDTLAAELSIGAVPMRRKQGIFKPRKITVATLGAHRIGPPPALVVQFDNNGVKTTYPMAL